MHHVLTDAAAVGGEREREGVVRGALVVPFPSVPAIIPPGLLAGIGHVQVETPDIQVTQPLP